MELKLQQLSAHLEKSLLPIYLVSGDEPLQVDEAMQRLRASAAQQGFLERSVFYVERGFRWDQLGEQTSNLSLFAEKKMIELRLSSVKLGIDGGKALQAYCERMPEDVFLLIQSGKLDKAAIKTKWVSAINTMGGLLRIWDLSGNDLINWTQSRLRSEKLADDRQMAEYISSRAEGNMFAAAQEIEKMALLQLGEDASASVQPWLADQSKYTVFDLVDKILGNDRNKVLAVLKQVRADSLAPTLVVWGLAELLRAIIFCVNQGQRKSGSIQNAFYFSKRDRIQSKSHKFTVEQLYSLLSKCAGLDQAIKGRASADVWDGLTDISLKLAR